MGWGPHCGAEVCGMGPLEVHPGGERTREVGGW